MLSGIAEVPTNQIVKPNGHPHLHGLTVFAASLALIIAVLAGVTVAVGASCWAYKGLLKIGCAVVMERTNTASGSFIVERVGMQLYGISVFVFFLLAVEASDGEMLILSTLASVSHRHVTMKRYIQQL